jgi:cbb3-type cytochrome oxidase subunit 3
MKQSVLSQFDMPWIPITGLLLFVFCFVAYTYWTFRKSNKAHYQEASMIPLEDERRKI